jgi:hypothetical protein
LRKKSLYIKSECALEGTERRKFFFFFPFASLHHPLLSIVFLASRSHSLSLSALHLKILIARGALFISHLFYFYSLFKFAPGLDSTPCVGKISKDRSAQQKKESERENCGKSTPTFDTFR